MISNSEIKKTRLEDLGKDERYSQELIAYLETKHYEMIGRFFNQKELNKWELMAPIVYAVRNRHQTFEMYLYCGEDVQLNPVLAHDVITKQIDLIDKSLAGANRNFIRNNIIMHPEIVAHMSEDLKADRDFLIGCINQNAKTADYIVEITEKNPALSQDTQLKEAIIKSASDNKLEILKNCTAEEKNNYSFIEDICKKNSEAIEYIANNPSEFGKEGLQAAKDVLIDTASTGAIEGFKKEADIVSKKQEEAKKEGKSAEEIKQLELENKKLERHARFFERVRKGELDPVKAAKLIDKICEGASPEFKKKVQQLISIDDEIVKNENEKVEGQVTTTEVGKKTIGAPTHLKLAAQDVEERGLNDRTEEIGE